ncbi:efflux RND transporter periplasmic adaptor subunit [Segnochrobactrum spirostomi]|uniref:HlyD family secretion protein n=1 Tax=Segnochrobactrum spirostomi TaxID=2608987 RepID=A0A6A7YCB3_9HYPH|nr:HlyD family secretion protein [Segnochrobactrum spirostomi]MQT15029.1 HlyD family secretion protein [Segnochrobactrum spirostomi]
MSASGPAAEPAGVRGTGHWSRLRRALGLLLTVVALVLAGFLGWRMWQTYMTTPWTRDGTVRAYVVTVTPQVSGRIVDLPVKADQFVHKGDLLMVIDPSDYQIALANAEAVVAGAEADLANKKMEAQRRAELNALAVSQEEQQSFAASAAVAAATLQRAIAVRDKAKLDLDRTRIVSPVNGYVTNLLTQPGDYATSGQRALSVVDSDSFWVDGYFEESLLGGIHVGDAARVSLMAHPEPLRGHVVGIGRGISVSNAEPDGSGLATVNPVFTWVRLAQRVPVRIVLDDVPPSIVLVAGLTATVSILPD